MRPSLDPGSDFLTFVFGITNQHLQPNTGRLGRSGKVPIHSLLGVVLIGSERDTTRFWMYTAVDRALPRTSHLVRLYAGVIVRDPSMPRL